MEYTIFASILLAPLLGIFLMVLLDISLSQYVGAIGRWAGFVGLVISSFITIGACIWVVKNGQPLSNGEGLVWFDALNVRFSVSINSWNVLLLLGVSVMFPALVFSELQQGLEKNKVVVVLLSLLQPLVIGSLISEDLFLTAFFWTGITVPIYFVLDLLSTHRSRSTSGKTMFLYGLSNLSFLIGLLVVFFEHQGKGFTFSILRGGNLAGESAPVLGPLSISDLSYMFFCFSFLFRMPIWPVAGWLNNWMQLKNGLLEKLFFSVLLPVGVFLFSRISYELFQLELHFFKPIFVGLSVVGLFYSSLYFLRERSTPAVHAMVGTLLTSVSLLGVASADTQGIVGAWLWCMTAGFSYSALLQLMGSGRDVFPFQVRVFVFGLSVLGVASLPGSGSFIGQTLMMFGLLSNTPWLLFGVVLAMIVLIVGSFGKLQGLAFSEAQSASIEPPGGFYRWSNGLFYVLIFGTVLSLGLFPGALLDFSERELLQKVLEVKWR